jgi:hypothetical protein
MRIDHSGSSKWARDCGDSRGGSVADFFGSLGTFEMAPTAFFLDLGETLVTG